MIRRTSSRGLAVVLCTLLGFSASAAEDRYAARANSDIRPGVAALKLDVPAYAADARPSLALPALDPSLVGAVGEQQVIVRLRSDSVAALGDDAYFSDQINHKAMLQGEQASFVSRLQAADPSVQVLGRVQHVLNAVFLAVPADLLTRVASDPDVIRVAPVGHYRLELTETVPYIGAAAVQDSGFTGKGISVAVLDSGVDYTHADLGGSGDPLDYINNDGTIIEPGSFPTDKVVGGFDFLGNEWPTGPGGFSDPPMPDPDPLDDLALIPGAFAGHGTHVADIIGGVNGVAPGVDLYAVKVCASLTPSCNGISLILGMEFAVDPNGDGDTSDHIDVINLSLGADYGQPFDDDLSAAVNNASAIGSFTVAAAGNCADQPYCTGTPSAAPTALSVAQTQVPSAVGFIMNVVEPADQAGFKEAVKYSWTPDPVGLIERPVQYGDLDGTNLDGCLAFTGDLSGLIVAVDRGGCFFSDKIRNIENAGGVIGIVMLVDGSAPFDGAFGGGDPINIPGFNISQADGDILRFTEAVVQFGEDLQVSLAGSTTSTSARGPDMSFNAIKPEIAAPGASVSADVATGTGRASFGGTSGASPMVAGSAALLQEACRAEGKKKKGRRYGWYRDWDDDSDDDSDNRKRGRNTECSPLKLKALLMNNGFRDVISDTTKDLAEITRIGGGEVRVDQSVNADFWAYSPDDQQPALSLGFHDTAGPVTIKRKVRVVNTSKRLQRIDITPTFRYGDDAATGAVEPVLRRDRIFVLPGKSRTFTVKFKIDPSRLTGNFMNSGSNGNNPAALTLSEYDGYLLLESRRGKTVALPWHIWPRQAAEVEAERQTIVEGGFPDSIPLTNFGAGVAQNDAYNLIGLSDEMPRGGEGEQMPMPDLRAVGVNTFPVPAGFCSANDSFVWVFAINTWDRQTHLMPVSHQIFLDTNQDGVDDYIVLNRDGTLNNVTDGFQLSWVVDLATGAAGAFFFAEHATNTGNTALTICAEQVGLSGPDLLATNVNATVLAQDFYNGGPGDIITGITITPLGERFLGQPSGDLLAGESGTLDVLDFGAFPGNSPEAGVMLFTNGSRGTGANGGATEATEALLFLTPDVEPPAPLPEPGPHPGPGDDDDEDSDNDEDSDD